MAQRRWTYARLKHSKGAGRLGVERRRELLDDAGLANPGTTDEGHRAHLALLERPLRRSPQHSQLRVATDQRGAELGRRRLTHGGDVGSKDPRASSLCWPDRGAWRRTKANAPRQAPEVWLAPQPIPENAGLPLALGRSLIESPPIFARVTVSSGTARTQSNPNR